MSDAEQIMLLVNALLDLATNDPDSDPCWCSAEWRSPSWAYHTEHSPACRSAREALAAAGPEPAVGEGATALVARED